MRYVLYILLLLTCCPAAAQTTASVNVSITMPSVALIDILPAGSTNVTLTMTAPTEAGNGLNTGGTNSTNWLIFTSAVAAGASRSIRSDLVGSLPAGVLLNLQVSPYAGGGSGLTGVTVAGGSMSLTNTAATVIGNIKGAYTGTTYGTSGFKLNYTLQIQNYGSVKSGSSSVTVRYTMVDN